MDIKPYLIVPKFIPQPTWGGNYIATFKGRTESDLSVPIGQSYELSSESMLTTISDSNDLPIEIGDPSTGKTTKVIGEKTSLFSLQSFMEEHPEEVVGQKYIAARGKTMDILIKFTQAKGNSFQVHVKPGVTMGHWKAKPESWYFFEPGKATLGLKDPTNDRLTEYKRTCESILSLMEELSSAVKTGTKTPGQAKVDAAAFLSTHSPFVFVNEINVPKDSIIDLSQGGIHHSWEEGGDIPNGNIVYEVQLNVMDTDCTLRSFDKGKISDDGKIRPIHIDDYFEALDTDPAHNDGPSLMNSASDTVLFDTPYYKTKKSSMLSPMSDSFQHVFVKEGILEIAGLTVRKGASVFIPKSFDFAPISTATLLITYF